MCCKMELFWRTTAVATFRLCAISRLNDLMLLSSLVGTINITMVKLIINILLIIISFAAFLRASDNVNCHHSLAPPRTPWHVRAVNCPGAALPWLCSSASDAALPQVLSKIPAKFEVDRMSSRWENQWTDRQTEFPPFIGKAKTGGCGIRCDARDVFKIIFCPVVLEYQDFSIKSTDYFQWPVFLPKTLQVSGDMKEPPQGFFSYVKMRRIVSSES